MTKFYQESFSIYKPALFVIYLIIYKRTILFFNIVNSKIANVSLKNFLVHISIKDFINIYSAKSV